MLAKRTRAVQHACTTTDYDSRPHLNQIGSVKWLAIDGKFLACRPRRLVLLERWVVPSACEANPENPDPKRYGAVIVTAFRTELVATTLKAAIV